MKNKLMLLVVGVLVAGLFPAGATAQEAPAIQLLNPSDYSTPPELSTKPDRDGLYHFVAWVPQVPPSPFVEFEIEPTAGNRTTIEATRVGTSDTWEASHNLAGLADGQYTIHAILYSEGQQFGGSDSQVVTINNSDLPPPPQSETAEITYPSNGESLGFYTPAGGRPNAIVDVATSEGALQVRVLYTKSAPGTDPEWIQCGRGTVGDSTARVRCTLAEGDFPTSVRAIAAVANMTPPQTGAAEPTADESGDAHRISTYTSVPTRILIDPEAKKQDVGTCLALTAVLLDQQSRPVAGANLDVHATGPTDNLQFASIANTTSAFQAPEKGPHNRENAVRCSDNTASGQQGDTNRVPGDDEKHIESTGGTTNNGAFTFALRSRDIGGTQVVAYADDNDDDVQQVSEASGGARIGWGEDPPAPVTEVFLTGGSSQTVGSCERMTLTIRQGGNALIGVNADVHLTGGGAFCTVSGGSVLSQPSDAQHTAGTHTDGTQHGEGSTNSFGQLIFGVTSAAEGEVVVVGWYDELDDDTIGSGEQTASTRVSFAVSGDRDVSLNTSRRRIQQGRRVRLFGRIDGSDACSSRQTVRLQSRRPEGRFRTIKTKLTNDEGAYSWRLRPRRTKDYRVVAPRDGVCDLDRSPVRRVRVRR